MLSTQQTIYHGVPALFFPVYFDQITNARNAVNQGMALELNLHDFSEQEFETAVNRIIHDSK
jgi:UDP:flavonoid glycosyltransferase YjiC (YdhE family)